MNILVCFFSVIDGGIGQAVPEHPKREHILALSTAFGDAYLFQAPSQIELENWINAIHSACASSFARQHGKENTLKLLRSEIQKLENSIDIVSIKSICVCVCFVFFKYLKKGIVLIIHKL